MNHQILFLQSKQLKVELLSAAFEKHEAVFR